MARALAGVSVSAVPPPSRSADPAPPAVLMVGARLAIDASGAIKCRVSASAVAKSTVMSLAAQRISSRAPLAS
jgi:hypothetical protein